MMFWNQWEERERGKKIEEVAEEILKKEPDTFLSADIIVGYPAEGDGEFESTKTLVDAVPFSWIHAFPFSPRPGTEAANLKTLPNEVVQKRMSYLLELANNRRKAFVEKHMGKELEVVMISQGK